MPLLDHLGMILSPAEAPAPGDMIVRGLSGGWTTVPMGIRNQVFQVGADGQPTWSSQPISGLQGPPGAAGAPGVGAKWRGIYSASIAYQTGEGVWYRGLPYISNSNNNLAHTPLGDPDEANWSPLELTDMTPVGQKSGDYTANPGEWVAVNALNGPVTITLPAAPVTGTTIGIKRVSSPGGFPVTIATQYTDVIDSPLTGSSHVMAMSEDAVIVRYAGAGSSAAYNPSVASTPGLVSYWRLGDGNVPQAADSKDSNPGTYPTSYTAAVTNALGVLDYWRLNDSSGPIADSVGSHSGTILGSTITLGNPGTIESDTSAEFFNDSTSAIRVRNDTNPIIGALPSWTMEAWVKTTNSQSRMGIYDERPSAGGNQVALMLNSGMRASVVYTDAAGTTEYVFGGNPLNDGLWHHIVATRNGSVFTVYADGVEVGQSTSSVTNTFNGVECRIGGDVFDPVLSLNGYIQEVTLYNSALSDAVVEAHYGLGTGHPDWRATPGALVASGDLSSAAVLAGSAITVADAANLRITGNLTAEAWINPTSVSGIQKILSKLTGSTGYEFGLNGAHLYLKTNGTTVNGTQSVVAGLWQHVAVTLSGTTVTFYLNGVSSPGGAGVVPSSTTVGMTIGASFLGEMEELALYSVALAGSVIATHYQNGTLLSMGVWYSEMTGSDVSISFEYVSVKDGPAYFMSYPYNAVGDGVTDDSGPLLQFANDAKRIGGGELIVPQPPGGSYSFAKPVSLSDLFGVKIRGVGSGGGNGNQPTFMYNGDPTQRSFISVTSPLSMCFEGLAFQHPFGSGFTGALVNYDWSSRRADCLSSGCRACNFGSAGSSAPETALAIRATAFLNGYFEQCNFNQLSRSIQYGSVDGLETGGAYVVNCVTKDCALHGNANPPMAMGYDVECCTWDNMECEPLAGGIVGAFEGLNGASPIYGCRFNDIWVGDTGGVGGNVFKRMWNADRACYISGGKWRPATTDTVLDLRGIWVLESIQIEQSAYIFTDVGVGNTQIVLIGGIYNYSQGLSTGVSPVIRSLGALGAPDMRPNISPGAHVNSGFTHTITLAEMGTCQTFTANGARTITVNPQSAGASSTFPVGGYVDLYSDAGAGPIHVVGGSGVTIKYGGGGANQYIDQGCEGRIRNIGTDLWILTGQVAAS